MCGRFSLGATIRVGQLLDLPNWPETPTPVQHRSEPSGPGGDPESRNRPPRSPRPAETVHRSQGAAGGQSPPHGAGGGHWSRARVGEGDGGGGGAGIGGASSGRLGGGAGAPPPVRSCISALTHVINPASDRRSSSAAPFANRAARFPALCRGLGTGRTEARNPQTERWDDDPEADTSPRTHVPVPHGLAPGSLVLARQDTMGHLVFSTPMCVDRGQRSRWPAPGQQAHEQRPTRHNRMDRVPGLTRLLSKPC
jgi:hypothetical protein